MEKGEDRKKRRAAVLPAPLELFTEGGNLFLGTPTNKRGLADGASVRSHCEKPRTQEEEWWETGEDARNVTLLTKQLYYLHQETLPPGNQTGNNWWIVEANEQSGHNWIAPSWEREAFICTFPFPALIVSCPFLWILETCISYRPFWFHANPGKHTHCGCLWTTFHLFFLPWGSWARSPLWEDWVSLLNAVTCWEDTCSMNEGLPSRESIFEALGREGTEVVNMCLSKLIVNPCWGLGQVLDNRGFLTSMATYC